MMKRDSDPPLSSFSSSDRNDNLRNDDRLTIGRNDERQRRQSRSDSEGVLRKREVDLPSTEWVLRPGLQGRRVVIKGLPGMVPDADIRKLGKDCDLEPGDEGCIRLPP